ncbi:unnamed protein product [Heligmosomoides polygyrus]|uniref:Uncharacterized protein n=1 Tax=Heligmosomoides polygyrus TaxID=6339 RepID=A0A3P8DA61_HELPZ|nr:unnamed protein product [Heligmosomoides polygyrus]
MSASQKIGWSHAPDTQRRRGRQRVNTFSQSFWEVADDGCTLSRQDDLHGPAGSQPSESPATTQEGSAEDEERKNHQPQSFSSLGDGVGWVMRHREDATGLYGAQRQSRRRLLPSAELRTSGHLRIPTNPRLRLRGALPRLLEQEHLAIQHA